MNHADALEAEAAELERCAARLRERAQQLREPSVPAAGERSYLRAKDLAELLRVNERTVRRWRDERRLPEPVAVAGIVRWRAADIDAWLAARVASSNHASLPRQRAG